jgi:two-component system sensor histidine kinase KdpD
VRLLVAFADEAAIAIENARLYKEASTVGALREADRLKTELLANVSHDLRTPLTSIKGYTTTILRHYDRLTDDEKRDFLHEIEIASDRLTELIENLLQLSRLEAGGFHMQKEPVVIVSMLSNAIEDVEQKTKGYRFVSHYQEPLPLIDADPRRIRQVLDNLLSNAVKYSPEGTEIAVVCEVMEKELMVRVRDQGVGISPEELDKVFDRFYQASSGASQRGGGVGLGLAICKGIIEAHGGRIWAESTLGKGSTFIFTLPLEKGSISDETDESRDL